MLSLIVPIYNVEHFLPYSIESIINQTYSNLEIILVNDGSTDKSKYICEIYQHKDKRIKLINQSNLGLSGARNTGIDNVTGDYIGFIDPDDVISLEFYECLYKLMVKTNSDIAECAYVKISEEELFNKKYKFDSMDNFSYITVDSEGALHRIHNEEKDIILKSVVVWNKLYKRDIWKDIRFPVGKRYEDDLTTYKLFSKINRLVSTERKLHNYVQRKNSLIHEEFSLKRLEALDVFDNHVNFCKGYADKYLLSKCLVRYLRMLSKILEELYQSNYQDKDKVKRILQNKFEEVYSAIEDNIDNLNIKQLNYILQEKKIYCEKFYKMI